jgi:peptidoglycan/LPS O-acetylase OafA/YrhL
LEFMTFSLGGALLILAGALSIKPGTLGLTDSLAVLGRNSLQAFVFHIFVIFVFFRYLLDLKHKVPYQGAVALTLLLLMGTVVWVSLLEYRNKWTSKKLRPGVNS